MIEVYAYFCMFFAVFILLLLMDDKDVLNHVSFSGSQDTSENDKCGGEYCEICGRGPMQKKHDLKQHKQAKHTEEDKPSTDNDSKKRRDKTKSTGEIKKELGIGYDTPEWAEEEDNETEILEHSSSPRQGREERLKCKWRKVLSILESEGEVRISPHTHYNSLRGNDIIRCFENDFKHMHKNYGIEVKYGRNGYIRKKDIKEDAE